MGVLEELYKRIKEEITNDPDKIGYAGKTDEEIVTLLNKERRGTKVVETYDGTPIQKIINNLPSIPNTCSLTDVVEAKKVTLTEG